VEDLLTMNHGVTKHVRQRAKNQLLVRAEEEETISKRKTAPTDQKPERKCNWQVLSTLQ